jgi:hypothetical protein
MNRYEEILTRLVAASVVANYDPVMAADNPKLRKAAALLESHFQARELAQEAVKHALGEVSCLLKPQAG